MALCSSSSLPSPSPHSPPPTPERLLHLQSGSAWGAAWEAAEWAAAVGQRRRKWIRILRKNAPGACTLGTARLTTPCRLGAARPAPLRRTWPSARAGAAQGSACVPRPLCWCTVRVCAPIVAFNAPGSRQGIWTHAVQAEQRRADAIRLGLLYSLLRKASSVGVSSRVARQFSLPCFPFFAYATRPFFFPFVTTPIFVFSLSSHKLPPPPPPTQFSLDGCAVLARCHPRGDG